MKRILLGASIWGEQHFEMFFKYCLPSLMCDGNLPALSREYEIGINIHTDIAGRNELAKHSLPMMVYCDVTNEDKYTQLARHQHMDLKMAKATGADYHLLMPDFFYSENCFTGILEARNRGEKAIARLVISTTKESICPYLNMPKSAVELATLSLQHMHPGVKGWLVDEIGLPNTHVLAWVGESTMRMCSPHCSPVYIANDAILIPNSTYPLDSILDQIVDGDIYLPKIKDGIVIIEIAPEASRQPNDKRISLQDFSELFRGDSFGSEKQWEIFNQETVDAIDRSQLSGTYWNDVEICKQKRIVNDAIRKGIYAVG